MRNAMIVGLAAVVGLSCAPFAVGQGFSTMQAMPAGYGHGNPYAAPACAAPGYGAQGVQQGCNLCSRACCEDVWAGYCQNKHHGGICLPCLGVRHGQRHVMNIVGTRGCSDGCAVPLSADPQPAVPTGPADSAPAPPAEAQPLPAPPVEPPPLNPTLDPSASRPVQSPPNTVEVSVKKVGPAVPMLNPAAWTIGTGA